MSKKYWFCKCITLSERGCWDIWDTIDTWAIFISDKKGGDIQIGEIEKRHYDDNEDYGLYNYFDFHVSTWNLTEDCEYQNIKSAFNDYYFHLYKSKPDNWLDR